MILIYISIIHNIHMYIMFKIPKYITGAVTVHGNTTHVIKPAGIEPTFLE